MEELSFGRWLSRYRKSLGLTQKQLAEQINCATITVRKLEAEQRRPSMQVIERLANVMRIPAQQLKGFIQFARGNGQPKSIADPPAYPWQAQAIMIQAGGLGLPYSQMEPVTNLPSIHEFFFDQNVQSLIWSNPAWIAAVLGNHKISPTRTSRTDENITILMLVPVEIPAQLANALIHSLGYQVSSTKGSSIL